MPELGNMMLSPSDKELLKELKTGQTFSLKYLGSVPISESLTKLSGLAERDNLTRHCMYNVCSYLDLCAPNPKSDERLLMKLGPVKVENRDVELNVALHAFVILDEDGIRILERHPIDVISFASSGTEEGIRGVFCFVSNVNKEIGRRCLVFMEPDKNVDFIIETIRHIFRLNNKGHGNKQSITNTKAPDISRLEPNLDHTYMNVCNLPAALGLERQPWFHGEMERAIAESLLRHEGDFLVRISPNTANNFVLSGIANSVAKHFLLLDENDQKVRKQRQVFETIVELIEYHRAKNVPIISEGSELHLNRPIVRLAAPIPPAIIGRR